jgi:uncharacterized OB-fold protein
MIYKSPIQGWRQYASRYSLQGVICKLCKKTYFPQKYICECGVSDFEDHKFGGLGTLISFTNISSPAAEFKSMPTYCLGLIQLNDGPVIMAQITDVQVDDLKTGMKLIAVFRRFYACGFDGIIEYGLKFVPLLNS